MVARNHVPGTVHNSCLVGEWCKAFSIVDNVTNSPLYC